MKKLELKDIIGYADGLYCEFTDFKKGTKSINLVDKIRTERDYIFSCKTAINHYSLDLVKPTLYPLDALYNPMPDGTIPIVECAKMAFPNKKWYMLKKCAAKSEDGLTIFKYDTNYNSFSAQIYAHLGNYELIIRKQYQIFDYLNSLKIDYRGLIDAGLAVSVYDLEINPYK